MSIRKVGTIYLLHFDSPVGDPKKPNGSAQHYLGWTSRTPEIRLIEHQKGMGCPLVEHAHNEGIDIEIARTWAGTRDDERKLKNRKNTPRLCPICSPKAMDRARSLKPAA